jgi:hypothetical protein
MYGNDDDDDDDDVVVVVVVVVVRSSIKIIGCLQIFFQPSRFLAINPRSLQLCFPLSFSVVCRLCMVNLEKCGGKQSQLISLV